jgi:hypothetical protein
MQGWPHGAIIKPDGLEAGRERKGPARQAFGLWALLSELGLTSN